MGCTGREIIVVNDGSTDGTSLVARAHHARVIESRPLLPGWTGKTWACFQGAEAAMGDSLLFLDADTWFTSSGFDRLMAAHPSRDVALSLLPFHVTRKSYEELSLFFNLLMAFGAGGFGSLGGPRLFGQSLLISRQLYERCGGHAAVRGTILENLVMSQTVEMAEGRCRCLGGRGVLNVRMFPEGFRQLREGWIKAFAAGAAASDPRVLGVSIFWLSALCSTFLLLLLLHGFWRAPFAVLYVCFAAQVYWFARQIGTFRVLTCVLFPVPLLFFFGLFTQSLVRRLLKQQVTWRGRQL